MVRFADHFSGHARQYAGHRPDYPAELFAYLGQAVAHNNRAWDCGAGNGQAAIALTTYFHQVMATDASLAQIRNARRHDNIVYWVARAEQSALPDACIDLICVAQALHWFDLAQFYQEVRRVARPRALLAVWCYGLARIEQSVDAVLDRFYREVVGSYWPPQRRWIDNAYGDIPFPFPMETAPSFEIRKQWDLDELCAYVSTWSATKQYIRSVGNDPITALRTALSAPWGEETRKVTVRWPVTLRLGRVNG